MLNQATQVILSDVFLPHASTVECNLYHSGTYLDAYGHYCAEDANMTEDSVGDYEYHELISKYEPKEIQWKTKMSEIKVGCNSSTEENN